MLSESSRYRDAVIPDDDEEQKRLLRALMNVRPPEPVSEFLKIQDAYLSAERDRAGIVDAEALPHLRSDSRLVLWQGDITTLKADAIVNAANSAMLGCFHPLHGCIDNIIHSRSGIQLRLTCSEIMKRQGHEEPAGKSENHPCFQSARQIRSPYGRPDDLRLCQQKRL